MLFQVIPSVEVAASVKPTNPPPTPRNIPLACARAKMLPRFVPPRAQFTVSSEETAYPPAPIATNRPSPNVAVLRYALGSTGLRRVSHCSPLAETNTLLPPTMTKCPPPKADPNRGLRVAEFTPVQNTPSADTTIVPLFPAATNKSLPKLTVFRCSEVPDVWAVHSTPSGDVTMEPA